MQQEEIKAYRDTVQVIADSAFAGTARWWVRQLKKFQYGDNLEVDTATGDYFYAVEDVSKQIIKHVSMSSGIIKLAAEDGNGARVALNTAQQDAVKAYANNICVWGAMPKLISLSADSLKLEGKIYYNALYLLERVKDQVNLAISNHIGNLGFGGTLYLTKLIDAVQGVEGVEDVVFDLAEAKNPLSSYRAINRIYQPLSGYMAVDSDYPLQTGLTFIPS